MELKSIDRIFWDAAQLRSAEERNAYLEQACGDDVALRQRVEKFLQARSKADNFLESPPPVPAATVDERLTERPGMVIGPYKLLMQIGEGGFGVVFMAEQQQPLHRKVALKVVKPGMDSKQVIARFEAERQALALMDHPNIARVLDAGATDTGRPYFVMELVRGIPITQFCDEKRLTPQERLKLFVLVCQAVQHAHQKGIIHRDLKPSNILVTLYDGTPVPKVIDFGVAKAMGQQPIDKTLFTGFAQMVGTPLYMSPEQAALSGLDVDTRSDVYALGVLLYELLTGTTPFDAETLRRAGYDEMRRIIREEEPPKPSTRLSTLEKGSLSTVAECRGVEPHKLRQQIYGELDWIMMRALEKDRQQRYESVSAFAADVQRYLGGESVQACSPSALYRLQKFARRHKMALATTGLVVAALLAGTVVSAWQAIEANRARGLAENNFALARQAVDQMYTEVAEKWLAEQPHMTDKQREFLQNALKFYQSFAQQAGTEPAVQLETARAYKRVGSIQAALGNSLEAETAYRAALHILKPLASEFSSVPEYRQELANNYNNLGNVLNDTGRQTDAEKAYRAALKLVEQLTTDFPDRTEHRQKLAGFEMNLCLVLSHLGRGNEAEMVCREALRIHDQLATDFPAVPQYRQNLAKAQLCLSHVVGIMGRNAEEETAVRAAVKLQEPLAAQFPAVPQYREDLAISYNNLGVLLTDTGRPAEAEATLRAAVKLREQLAAEFPTIPQYRQKLAGLDDNLGRLLRDNGKQAEAETAYRAALKVQEQLVTEFLSVSQYRVDLARSHTELGHLMVATGRRAEAESSYRAALRILEPLGTEFPSMARVELANCYNNLGGLLRDTGRLAEAESTLRAALRIKEELANEFPTVLQYREASANTHYNLGQVLWDTGKLGDAATEFRSTLKLREQLVAASPSVPRYRESLAISYHDLGVLLVLLGRRAEAETCFRAALKLREELIADFSTVLDYAVDLGITYYCLGKLQLEQTKGEPATAFESLAQAIHTLSTVLAKDEHHPKARKFLIAAHRDRIGARLQRHQYAEALPDFDHAIELAEGTERDYFRVHRAITLLRTGQTAEAVDAADSLTQGKNLTGEVLYNAACFYALASAARTHNRQQTESHAAKAITLLRRAQAAGYFQDAGRVGDLKQDTDFDTLRSRGDYQRLIQELEKKTHQAGK
jgi:serine/threonine protein kinase